MTARNTPDGSLAPVTLFTGHSGRVCVRPATDAPPVSAAGLDIEGFIKEISGDAYVREVGINPERLRQHLIDIYGENYPRY